MDMRWEVNGGRWIHGRRNFKEVMMKFVNGPLIKLKHDKNYNETLILVNLSFSQTPQFNSIYLNGPCSPSPALFTPPATLPSKLVL